METSTTNTFLSDHIVKALCNTLMHSLWQGILLALITGAIIILTRKASAAFRYNLLIGALTLFAFGVTATFIWRLQKPVTHDSSYRSTTSHTTAIQTTAAQVISTGPASEEAADPIAQPTATGNMTETVIGYFNTHANTIVLIWFLFICARSVQMAVGLHSVSHLKRTNVFEVSKDWEDRLLQLAQQLHIQQAIRLMESGIAKAPMVVGYLKPAILIPIGLINSLTTNEVEAILTHELAHIRRRDYLVNLLQCFMEIVFFFNPAVLWISQLIKTERENCCDDLAIAQGRNKESYIRALVSCEEYKAAGAAYVMAFPGAKNTLLHRVSRMVGNRNYSLSMFEKTILAFCLVVMGLGISAFTARENINRENIKKGMPSAAPVSSPANPELHRIHPDAGANHIEKVKVVKSSTPVKKQPAPVHNSTAPPSQLRHPALALPAKPDTNKRAFDTSRAIGRELYLENLLTDTNHLSISLNEYELIVNGVRMPQQVHERIYRQFGPGNNYGGSLAPPFENRHPGPYDAFLRERSEEIAAELIRDHLASDKDPFTYTFSRDELSINGVRQSDEFRRRLVDKYFKPDDNFNLNFVCRDPGSYRINYQKSYSPYANSYSSDADRYHNPDAYSQSLREAQKRSQDETDKKLVADLLQDGLITDPNNVTFTLNDKEVIINGKKQSDETYQKYKEKYMPRSGGGGWSWTYSHHE
jgi:beta-lactamase regulating signal transducer with metallopeptidase domain